MPLPPLLRKELAWGRRKLLVLVLLFVLLPGALAYGTLSYDHVLPTDTPVAVVPQSDAVSGDDVNITRGAVTFFSDPVTYDDRAAAFRALEREQVYAIVTVPPDVAVGDDTATFHLYVEGSVVPYHQPSEAVVNVLSQYLSRGPASSIAVERHVVGTEHTLSEYLVPTFELVLAMLVALTYLPYTLSNERGVFERLRVERSLTAVVAWKLAFFTALVAVPVGVFAVTAGWFGYGLDVTAAGAVAFYLLTFVLLAATSMAVTLATQFATWGRLLNLVLFLFLLLFSGLFYPAGFFSGVRRELVRLMPTHYAMVAIRGYVLRDATLGTYADWLALVLGVTLLSLLALRGAIYRYEAVQ
jgi:ABC-2 type transport system permease protein